MVSFFQERELRQQFAARRGLPTAPWVCLPVESQKEWKSALAAAGG